MGLKISNWSLKDLFGRNPLPTAQAPASVTAILPNYEWFGVVEGNTLEQGDIFEECPVFFPPEEIREGSGRAVFAYGKLDLIVISQSCDLVKGQEKIKQVSLCAATQRSKYKSGGQPAGIDRLEEIRTGRVPRYHMIASCELQGFEREVRIIDLQQVFSLPLPFLRARATREKRLRLLPPYREHLSQSFARVYMRVGLPINIPSFKVGRN